MSLAEKHTKIVKEIAYELGFSFCGISKAGFLEEEAPRLEKWLNNGRHGKMAYMENHFDKRLDPTKLVEGSKSVVSLLLNYFPSHNQNAESYKISKYAYGQDYHDVIKNKLRLFLQEIRNRIGEVDGRVFVDSAPVMDKVWAQKSGLGWVGKNGNLIRPQNGSFFFIAELIIDLELQPDGPIKDYCGTCSKCMDSCPTGALDIPYVVDGSKCISYLTIELKDELFSAEFNGKMQNWMFGCDICQDVCPWNRFSKPHSIVEFEPKADLLDMKYKDWEEMTQELFSKLFTGSAVKRTKFSGLKRNIEFLKNHETKK
ncbi:MAG: tRNA epoxyqueuosine(34) reductase QueG [Flavobacteriia bacterium]|nr:tRNA epoxyqueuosine(34) reductase QueG [Flavobacteriia bacterium]OJX36747.1 MAG: tRNA epoxyqueuosine(34) reductase QueG [Flavobacteriia bacterium 40-80]